MYRYFTYCMYIFYFRALRDKINLSLANHDKRTGGGTYQHNTHVLGTYGMNNDFNRNCANTITRSNIQIYITQYILLYICHPSVISFYRYLFIFNLANKWHESRIKFIYYLFVLFQLLQVKQLEICSYISQYPR